MLRLRICSPSARTEAVVELLTAQRSVSNVALLTGASIKPPGDVIYADIARESVNGVVDQLRSLGLHREGTIDIEPVRTWISRSGFEAERSAPGASADAVVWADVIQRSYEESELTYTYLCFMIMATLIASVGIVLDSQILLIGAMVLGPEFGAVAALGLALVRRRPHLLRHAASTLVVGFAAAILATAVTVLVGRGLGWVTVADVVGPRPGTGFIYQPDRWSFVVALIAGAAGVLAMTSGKGGGLVGVFISVTTVPAAGNVALGLAFAEGAAVWGSSLQLVLNISGMALAGWFTLAVQQWVWGRTRRR